MNRPDPAQIQAIPMREAMQNLEFVTTDQLKAANTIISRLTAEVEMVRADLKAVRAERNFLQAYASDMNASLDNMGLIWGRIRDQAKQFALQASAAPQPSSPAAPEAPALERPAEVRLDEQSETSLKDIFTQIEERPDSRLPQVPYN